MALSHARICLTVLLALHLISVVLSDTNAKGKTATNDEDLKSIVEQKTSQAIKKLEKQFKATFMAYTSAKGQGDRQQAHDKLQHLVSVVKREAKEKLEKSVEGYHFDVIQLPEKETQSVLEASYIRGKRSKSWGSCKPICKQRCLPTCNLVCCIAPPYGVTRKMAKKIEKQMGTTYIRKKSAIKQHAPKKKSAIKKHGEKKKSHNVKNDKRGSVCNKTCQIACLPSCKFRCCIAPKKH